MQLSSNPGTVHKLVEIYFLAAIVMVDLFLCLCIMEEVSKGQTSSQMGPTIKPAKEPKTLEDSPILIGGRNILVIAHHNIITVFG